MNLSESYFYDVTKSQDVRATEHGYGSLYFFISRNQIFHEALAASQQCYFERTMERYVDMARIDATEME